MLHKKNLSQFFVITIFLSLFLLQGCASKYGPQTTTVSYYPMCYQPVQQLRNEESNINTSTAGGAAIGAILGAVVGGLATGKAEGAVAGAAIGGVAGAISGHAYSSAKAKNRTKEFLRQYSGQLHEEAVHMSRANAAAKAAANCYNKEFRSAIAAAKAGRISKIELTNRYEEIRAGLQETSRILKANYDSTWEKDQEYRQIMAAETGVSDPVYAQNTARKSSPKKTYRPKATRTSSPEVKAAAQSTATWQDSRADLQETRQDLEEQIANNEDILEAALNG